MENHRPPLSANGTFSRRLQALYERHEALLNRPNAVDTGWYNGLFERYRHPVVSRRHIPLFWRYDLDPSSNPSLIERLGVNAVFNPGALYVGGKVYLMCRVEGYDRKSFFAVAESRSGTEGFRFWPYPVRIPAGEHADTNLYDMRLVRHEDGWIYGLFCTERRHPEAPPEDTAAAMAQCGIARTRDLKTWQRLPDLQTPSPQQRNVVLHPEYVDGGYAFYTRPQDGFVDAGRGGGIGWGWCPDVTSPVIEEEAIIDPRVYHTIKEAKNGAGPAPVRTPAGWLHIAHGVRSTAAGLRYVLYAFLCALDDPTRVTHQPGGYLLAPWKDEHVGDVSNVVFCNGVAARPDGTLLIYYASSDARTHVATTTVDRMLDYLAQTPRDGGTSHTAVAQRIDLIDHNLAYARQTNDALAQRIVAAAAPANALDG